MMSEVMLLALAVVLAFCQGGAHAVSPTPTATPPAPPQLNPTSKDFLEAHNAARAEVGVDPLKWSESLTNATSLRVRYQRDKMGCKFADLGASKYGGNQLVSSGQPISPRAAVEFWVAEKQYYNYANNSCAAGRQCGVYTQVVWRKSLELGCAQATCAKDRSTLTICFYDPPGNVIGESPY